MWYCESGNKKNDVRIILKKEHVDRLVELWRVTNRIICLKYQRICTTGGVYALILQAYYPVCYPPQTQEKEEKREQKGKGCGRHLWRRSQDWVVEDEKGKGSRT